MLETITQPVGLGGDSQTVNLGQAAAMLRAEPLDQSGGGSTRGGFPAPVARRAPTVGEDSRERTRAIPLADVRAVAQDEGAGEAPRGRADRGAAGPGVHGDAGRAGPTARPQFLERHTAMLDDVVRAGGTPDATPERMERVDAVSAGDRAPRAGRGRSITRSRRCACTWSCSPRAPCPSRRPTRGRPRAPDRNAAMGTRPPVAEPPDLKSAARCTFQSHGHPPGRWDSPHVEQSVGSSSRTRTAGSRASL